MPSIRKSKTNPTREAKSTRTTKERPGGGPRGVARAHRDDTPEARDQRERIPKTHPTRSPSAARKDSKGTGLSGIRRRGGAAAR